MRSDWQKPWPGRGYGPSDTTRVSRTNSRGAHDLAECGVCKKLFAPELLGPRPGVVPSLIRWDRRPKGPAHWRIGAPDTGRMILPDAIVKACAGCGGVVPKGPDEPLWKRAKREWKAAQGSQPWSELRGKRGG